MHKITTTTRQGTPVVRLHKATARRYFNEGKAITATNAGSLPEHTPDVFKDDGTDPMMWPSVTNFDSWANENDYYATNGVWYWGINTPSGLVENNG